MPSAFEGAMLSEPSKEPTIVESNPFAPDAIAASDGGVNPFAPDNTGSDNPFAPEKLNANKPTTTPSGTALGSIPTVSPGVPPVSNPNDVSAQPPIVAQPAVDAAEEQRIKQLIAGMPQYRETFFGGAELVKDPAAKTYGQGEYLKDTTDKAIAGAKGVANLITYPFKQTAEEEKADAMHGLLLEMAERKALQDPNATEADRQKARMAKEFFYGTTKIKQSAPAQFLQSTVGAAMRGIQENVLRPAGVIGFKSAMLPQPKMLEMGTMGQQAWASLTPEKREEIYLTELNDEQKEFYLRTRGVPAAQDVMPGKYVQPSSKEYYLREFLRATATDKFALSGEARAKAEGALPEIKIGGYNITPLFATGLELAGELPYYAMVPTGVGARVEAKVMAKAEKEGIALGAKEMAKTIAGAKAQGTAAEFAVQSAAVASKNKEDPVSAAAMGYVGGYVMGELENLLFKNRAIRKGIMSEVNAERASYGTRTDGSLILPPITWKEYVKQPKVTAAEPSVSPTLQSKLKANEILTKQAAKKEAALSQVSEGVIKDVPVTAASPQLGPEPLFGSRTAQHTFKTIEYGRSGELRVVHYLDNVKGGRKKVYSEPLKQSHFDEYRKVGSPEATDGQAYSEFLNLFEPSSPMIRQGYGKEAYASPELADALIEKGYVKPPKVDKPRMPSAPPIRDEMPTKAASPDAVERVLKQAKKESPKLLTVDKSGNVQVTPLVDRTPDTKALSPQHVRVGDVVHLLDGQLAVVDSITSDGVIVSLRNDLKIPLSRAEVTLAAEDMVDLSRIFGSEGGAPAVKPSPKVKGERAVFDEKRSGLLRMKELDIKRVMNAGKIDNPAEAKALLDDMVKAGQLEPELDGIWKVKKSYKPEALTGELKEQGYRYYYGTTPDGQGLSGIVRGRDPQKLGNVLIEVGTESAQIPNALPQGHAAKAQALGLGAADIFTNTKTISVPRSELRSYVPVLGNANLSQLPARLGINVPMPPNVLMTNQAQANAMADIARMDGQLNKLLVDKKSIYKGLQRLFNHEAWLVPTDIRQSATTLAAQKGVVKAQTEIYQSAIAKRLGGEVNTENIWLADIMKRRATKAGRAISDQERGLMRFFANNPQLDAEAQQTIRIGIARMKDLQTALARRGVGNIADLESARMLGLEDEYATNVYMKYLTQRTKWAEFVKDQLPQVWNKAYELIARRHPNEEFENVESRMQEYLGVDTDTLAKQIRSEPNGAVVKKLKERLQLATEVQNLLGKLDSASVQMAHSLATSESILRRIQVWDGIAASPYWSPGPRRDLGPEGGIQIPDSPIYGNARNGRVHESMRFLLEAKKPQAEGSAMVKTLTSVWKFNQVIGGGATPWINQIMRNWKGLVISGGLQDISDLHTVADAVEMMLKYHRNPILSKGSFYDQLIQNGGIGTGFAGSEINKNKAAMRILAEMRKAKGVNSYWDLMDKLTGSIKGTAEDAGAMYDAIDRAFKLTAGMNNYRRAIARGMSPNDAMALAVMRNNQSFVNFEMVSAATEKMRSSGVSAVAPFVSSKMEDLRINGTMLMRMKDEPDLVARMAVATGSIAAALALMREQRRANGISDETVRKALDKRPLGMQAFKPMSAVLPTLDEKGRIQVADVTSWEDAFMLLQMHERDNPAAAILRNNLTGVFGEENLMGMGINLGFNVAGGTVPLSNLPKMIERPGEDGWMQLMSFIAANGGLPNAPFKGYKIWQSTQPAATAYEKMFKEPLTEGQGAAKMWGIPIDAPIGSHTGNARAKELLRNMHEMDRQRHNAVMGKDRGTARELIKAKTDAEKEMIREYQESKK